MKILSSGFNTFNETGKYTLATVEYTGLFSYSILKRGGRVANAGITAVTRPVGAAVSRPVGFIREMTPGITAVTRPFGFIKDKTGGIFRSREHEERIRSLTEKLAEVEERLANVEKYGAGTGVVAPRVDKKISDDKRSVLKGILEETKALKEMK